MRSKEAAPKPRFANRSSAVFSSAGLKFCMITIFWLVQRRLPPPFPPICASDRVCTALQCSLVPSAVGKCLDVISASKCLRSRSAPMSHASRTVRCITGNHVIAGPNDPDQLCHCILCQTRRRSHANDDGVKLDAAPSHSPRHVPAATQSHRPICQRPRYKCTTLLIFWYTCFNVDSLW